jgi:dolichol-phosphate mannosyltransferase
MKSVVVIPTYQEASTLPAILDRILELDAGFHVLVVDDNSPDGTAEEVRRLHAQFDNVHLLIGKKAGLGSAYIRGMRKALDLGADVIIEMDADFSHKPEDVPRLLAALDEGADFVIGSRYVKGGSITAQWGFSRKLASRLGNLVARCMSGLGRVRDCTSGFRAIRSSLLARIRLDHFKVQGYAFQVALLHAAIVQKARVVEIPIDFAPRAYGESKLGFRDVVEFAVHAWWMFLGRNPALTKDVKSPSASNSTVSG